MHAPDAETGPGSRVELADWAEARPPRPPLHLCPSCAGELVYPVAWEQRVGERWRIERRCPECEWRASGEHALAEVDAFDDVLNDGTEALLCTLREAARASMEADVALLVAALAADALLPMDF